MLFPRLAQHLLRFLARVTLARERPLIIAVTGSVGKTTTKEAIYTVLAHRYGSRVSVSRSNLNNEFGVPLSILGMESAPGRWQYPAVLARGFVAALTARRPALRPIRVQELGAERPGDIAYLVAFLKPYLALGVVTTIGPIHLNRGQFSSVAGIEQEKGMLVEALPEDGWAVLNKDNPATRRMGKRTRAKVVWFNDRGIDTHIEIARAVGKIYGLKEQEIRRALQTFHRPTGRLNEFAGMKGVVVIDDSYNANPMSMQEALSLLGNRPGRRIAVLGDMLELGDRERLYHQQVGKLARGRSDVVVGVGNRARWYEGTYHFATPLLTASFLKKFVQVGDTVLVKGSQGMRMELVSAALLANPSDVEKLPRQTLAWKGKPFVQP